LSPAKHPVIGKICYPGAPFKLSETPWQLKRTAPRLGEHNEENLRAILWIQQTRVNQIARGKKLYEPWDHPSSYLWKGFGLLIFTQYWAGPMATSQLADMGAQVIHVESARVLDGWRRSGTPAEGSKHGIGPVILTLRTETSFSLALEVDTVKGKEIFKALVKVSDIVVENYSPTLIKKLGITYQKFEGGKDRYHHVVCSRPWFLLVQRKTMLPMGLRLRNYPVWPI